MRSRGRGRGKFSPELGRFSRVLTRVVLRVKRFSSLEKEYSDGWARPLTPLLDGSMSFTGEPDPNALFYLMLRASERFVAAHGRHPGTVVGGTPGDDIPLLLAELTSLLSPECGLGEAEIATCLQLCEASYVPEMCRVGGAEIHSTAVRNRPVAPPNPSAVQMCLAGVPRHSRDVLFVSRCTCLSCLV